MYNLISVIYALCGLCYTILAGRGKFFCFVFGLLSACLYSFISFKNALWASFLLNFCYFVPIQIISFFKWLKNTDKNSKTVKKTSLPPQKFFCCMIFAAFISLIAAYFLNLNHDKSPLLDGFIGVFSILGAYFTMLRVLEQWIVWSVVNFLTLLMWLILISKGSASCAIAALWACYLILGIIYYFRWRAEIKK